MTEEHKLKRIVYGRNQKPGTATFGFFNFKIRATIHKQWIMLIHYAIIMEMIQLFRRE